MTSVGRVAKWVASIVLLFIVYELMAHALDLATSPWAYGLTGRAAPDGRWHARIALPSDRPADRPTDLTLDLTLEPHAVQSLHRRIVDTPALVGRLVVCADGKPWPAEAQPAPAAMAATANAAAPTKAAAVPMPGDTNLQASTGWSGRDWTFGTHAAFGSRGSPRSIGCRYEGERFDCRLDFRTGFDPAAKARVEAIERKSGRSFQGFEVPAVFERVTASDVVDRSGNATTMSNDADRCRAPPRR